MFRPCGSGTSKRSFRSGNAARGLVVAPERYPDYYRAVENRVTSEILLPVVLVLWLAGVGYAFSSVSFGDEEVAATASPEPTPVALPTSVAVGRELDPSTGLVAEPVFRFEAGSTVAMSVWLGRPIGTDTVIGSLGRLEDDGFHEGGPFEVPVDKEALHIAALFSADQLMERLGPGTYLLKLELPSGDRIGYGELQLGTDVPEAVEVFVQWQAATIRAGDHTGYRFGPDGEVVEEMQASLDAEANHPAMFRATFGGREYLLMKSGPFENYYLPEPQSVSLADAAE